MQRGSTLCARHRLAARIVPPTLGSARIPTLGYHPRANREFRLGTKVSNPPTKRRDARCAPAESSPTGSRHRRAPEPKVWRVSSERAAQRSSERPRGIERLRGECDLRNVQIIDRSSIIKHVQENDPGKPYPVL